jgi:hypothetical protein
MSDKRLENLSVEELRRLRSDMSAGMISIKPFFPWGVP